MTFRLKTQTLAMAYDELASGKLARFRHGPAILAVGKQVPVIPLYMEGLRDIRAVGSREMKPGPVTVIIGKPIRFAPDRSARTKPCPYTQC